MFSLIKIMMQKTKEKKDYVQLSICKSQNDSIKCNILILIAAQMD